VNTLKELMAEHKLNSTQARVLQTLRKRSSPIHNRKLAVIMALPINIITPRMFELRKLGLVGHAGYTLDQGTNRTVSQWAAI
jgi:DNA-binding MarR family transcriptional regulator